MIIQHLPPNLICRIKSKRGYDSRYPDKKSRKNTVASKRFKVIFSPSAQKAIESLETDNAIPLHLPSVLTPYSMWLSAYPNFLIA